MAKKSNGTTKKILQNFKITSNAKARIEELKQDNPEVFIRIMITSGGCAGHQYHVLMDDYIGDTDYVMRKRYNHKNSIYVVIDEASLEFLRGATLDFTESLEFSGFNIKNPNAKSVCNCGSSFSCSGGFVSKKDNCTN